MLLDQYRLVDMARKVVGVGSVGTRSCMLLLLGTTARTRCSCRRRRPARRCWRPSSAPASTTTRGSASWSGQRLMQAVSDIFLGWVRVAGFDGQPRDFYMRQLRDWKGSAEIETMLPRGMLRLRRALRLDAGPGPCPVRGPRSRSRPTWVRRRLRRAPSSAVRRAYADQNERDHQPLVEAIARAGSPRDRGRRLSTHPEREERDADGPGARHPRAPAGDDVRRPLRPRSFLALQGLDRALVLASQAFTALIPLLLLVSRAGPGGPARRRLALPDPPVPAHRRGRCLRCGSCSRTPATAPPGVLSAFSCVLSGVSLTRGCSGRTSRPGAWAAAGRRARPERRPGADRPACWVRPLYWARARRGSLP